MKITKIVISDDYRELFSSDLNEIVLIWSSENSFGKTTLIRFILYSLGYDVPPTKKVNLNKYHTCLLLDNPKKKILRFGDEFTVECLDTNFVRKFDLSKEYLSAHSFLFGINNSKLINNLLGTFYIDQEKGWTLLNRGKVISSKIGFNIEDFILGLTAKDTTSYEARICKLEEDIKRYSAIYNIVLLNDEPKVVYKEEQQVLTLKCKKSNLSGIINELEKQRKELTNIYDNNKSLMDIVESYNLFVRVPNIQEPIKISKNNIVDFGVNQLILESQINELSLKIENLKLELEKINNELDEYSGLFSVDDASKQVIQEVKSINLNQSQLISLIDQLKKEKREIEKIKNELSVNDYKIVDTIAKNIKRFTEKLNVFEGYVSKESDYLRTRNLKEYSGALYHKVTLCYRLAYYCAVRDTFGLQLPFIIDSPGSAEVKADGMKEMIELIKEIVKEQIIVSSIYDKELGIEEKDKITLINGIFGDNL